MQLVGPRRASRAPGGVQHRLRVQASLVQTGLEECDLRWLNRQQLVSSSCGSPRCTKLQGRLEKLIVSQGKTLPAIPNHIQPEPTRTNHPTITRTNHIQPSNPAYPPSQWTYLPPAWIRTTNCPKQSLRLRTKLGKCCCAREPLASAMGQTMKRHRSDLGS